MTVLVAGTYALNPFGPQLAASHAVPEASCVNSRAATPGPSMSLLSWHFWPPATMPPWNSARRRRCRRQSR